MEVCAVMEVCPIVEVCAAMEVCLVMEVCPVLLCSLVPQQWAVLQTPTPLSTSVSVVQCHSRSTSLSSNELEDTRLVLFFPVLSGCLTLHLPLQFWKHLILQSVTAGLRTAMELSSFTLGKGSALSMEN